MTTNQEKAKLVVDALEQLHKMSSAHSPQWLITSMTLPIAKDLLEYFETEKGAL